MKRLRPVLDSPVPKAEIISASPSPRSILQTTLKTSKARTDLLRSDVAKAEEDDDDDADDHEEEKEEGEEEVANDDEVCTDCPRLSHRCYRGDAPQWI